MRGTGPTGRRKFAGKGWAIAGAMAVLMVASASGVLGQDTAAGLTGASRPDDVIMARQLLMDAIESEMTPIDLAVGGRQMPLADLKAALVYRPDHPYLLNYLGYAWADKGQNLDDSLKLIQRAVDVAMRGAGGVVRFGIG